MIGKGKGVLTIPSHKHVIGMMECMVIVSAPHKLCDFVYGTHFIIISDYHALHFVKSKHTHTITTDAALWWETSGCDCDVVCGKCLINTADPLSHVV